VFELVEAGSPGVSPQGGRWWVGVALWAVLLIAIDMTSRTIGLGHREAVYLIAAALASVGIVAIVAFARLAGSPPELRTLRFLAVLLPSVFVLSIQVLLYFLEIDETVTEGSEHVLATAVLSAGAIPFSVYVFRSFARLRDELARRAQHLESLHDASMALAGETILPRLDARMAEGVRSVVGADRAALLRRSDGTEDVVHPVPSGRALSVAEDELLRRAVATGEVAVAEDGRAALLAVPVRCQGEVIGALAALRERGGFTQEDQLLLQMFSVAASAALDNVTRLEEAQLIAMVEERERIARDLHDDLGQLLGFLTAKIQATHELTRSGRTERAQEELVGLEAATRSLSAHVREAILGLRARIGPDRPLARALEDYVADFGIQAGLSTEIDVGADAGAGLPGPAQYQLLRVAQEALSNARRHARATRVRVRLAETDGHLELSVLDDGRGFEPADASQGPGFGLRTMRERVEALHGEFSVESGPGEGTVVTVRTPIGGG
jgi:signal transduction histidine kinase